MLRTTLEQVNCPYLILSKNNTMPEKTVIEKPSIVMDGEGGGGGFEPPDLLPESTTATATATDTWVVGMRVRTTI